MGALVEYPVLNGERKADVVVVGGGITGGLVARRLSAEGRHIIVLERRRVASGTTGHSTAKVTALHSTSWRELLGKQPHDMMCTWALANLAAVNELSNIARATGTDCDLRTLSAYLVAGDDEASEGFGGHVTALLKAGLPVTALDAPSPFARPAAELPRQAMIDPAAFVLDVLSSLTEQVDVYERTPVRSLQRVDDGWCARCDEGSAWAPTVVMADHSPVHDTVGFFGRLFPYTHFVLQVAPRIAIPNGM